MDIKLNAALLATLLSCVLLSVVGPAVAAAQEITPRASGKLDFTLTTIDGREVTLSDYRGRVVLVNFWATWCGPCSMETPALVRLYNKYKSRGFVVIGVAIRSEEDQVNQFVNKFSVPYIVGRDTTGEIDRRYQIFSIPTSFLFFLEGKLKRRFEGFGWGTEEELDRELQALLDPVPVPREKPRLEMAEKSKEEARRREKQVLPDPVPVPQERPQLGAASVEKLEEETRHREEQALVDPAPILQETPRLETTLAERPKQETGERELRTLPDSVPILQKTQRPEAVLAEEKGEIHRHEVQAPPVRIPGRQETPQLEAVSVEVQQKAGAVAYGWWNLAVPLLAAVGLLVLSRVRLSAGPAELAGVGISTPVGLVQHVPYARLVRRSPVDTAPQEIAFVHNDVLIGSGSKCDVIIRHPSISRQHARVQWRKQGYALCDLKSTAGTYVNGRRIGENLLKEGWIVRLGEVEFIFTIPRIII